MPLLLVSTLIATIVVVISIRATKFFFSNTPIDIDAVAAVIVRGERFPTP